ncbi:dehydration-induced 19-like protein [Striga asiatica]|uniref:Dehydration-induced 19-like protein n=1 Tax=Striga asiatica TaxID=4170 RepID=A0A5A7QCY8_STRAF|nr:dehydration-induced 19-like protein [Striga asiatica]
MGDRFYDDLEIALSSYSLPSTDDYYNEEHGEIEEEYEEEGDNYVEIDEKSEELACPFCTDDFDVLGLCCHIDADHRMEVKPGICPVCATKETLSVGPSSNSASDSMLLSFVNNPQMTGKKSQSVEASHTNNASLPATSSTDDYIEKSKPQSLPTDVDNEKARRCEFLQGLLLTAILDDL